MIEYRMITDAKYDLLKLMLEGLEYKSSNGLTFSREEDGMKLSLDLIALDKSQDELLSDGSKLSRELFEKFAKFSQNLNEKIKRDFKEINPHTILYTSGFEWGDPLSRLHMTDVAAVQSALKDGGFRFREFTI